MIKRVVAEIAEEKVLIPENFSAAIDGKKITIKSDKGEISREFRTRRISLKKEDNTVIIRAAPATRKNKALVKTVKAHIQNILFGFEKEYEYKLAIVYSHFPINVAVKEGMVVISNFAGEKKPRNAKIVADSKIEVKGKEIIVTGHNKEAVGQTAANIERATKAKKKDARIFQDGIYLASKGIKTAAEEESRGQ